MNKYKQYPAGYDILRIPMMYNHLYNLSALDKYQKDTWVQGGGGGSCNNDIY